MTASWLPPLNRSLVVLFGCQVCFVAATVVVVTTGGIIGHQLAADPALATLPIALMVVGTAMATVPAALIMQRIGRRLGFLCGVGVAASGAWLCASAVTGSNFALLCVGTACIGASLGFSQQFRFAAAESVPLSKVSHAVSFILLGSILGAIAAPEIVGLSARLDPSAPYLASFYVLLMVYGIAGLFMILLPGRTPEAMAAESSASRPWSEVFTQPRFLTAVLAGVVGQGVMTYIMTATPIAMNVDDGFSIRQTSEVIRGHVVAMYLPSLVTPMLISRFGVEKVMAVGVAAFGATLLIGLAGHQLLHYWFALVILGVGWNFLFVSGTTMLAGTYRPAERFRAQAANDFAVFSTSAMASLLAGVTLHMMGWNLLLASTLPALLAMLCGLVWLLRRTPGQAGRGAA